MNVLIITDYLNAKGGADIVAQNHYKNFLLDETNICTLVTSETLGLSYQIKKINILKNLFNIKAYFKMRSLLKKYNPEIIYIHSWTKQLSSSIILACRNYNTNIILHDYFLFCPNGGFFNFNTKKHCGLSDFNKKCILINCDKNNYSTKIYRLLRFFIQKLIINFVNPTLIPLNDKQNKLLYNNSFLYENQIKKPLFIKDGSHDIYVYKGRSDVEKGIEIFSDPGLILKRELHIIGAEKFHVEDNVTHQFHGWVDDDFLKGLMPRVRLLIFPSIWYEVDPLVPYDFMMHGIPVVSNINNVFGSKLQLIIPELVYSNVEELNIILMKLENDFLYNEIRDKIYNFYIKEERVREHKNKKLFNLKH